MRGSFPLNGTYFQVNEVNTYQEYIFSHSIPQNNQIKRPHLETFNWSKFNHFYINLNGRCLRIMRPVSTQWSCKGVQYGICVEGQSILEHRCHQYLKVCKNQADLYIWTYQYLCQFKLIVSVNSFLMEVWNFLFSFYLGLTTEEIQYCFWKGMESA